MSVMFEPQKSLFLEGNPILSYSSSGMFKPVDVLNLVDS